MHRMSRYLNVSNCNLLNGDSRASGSPQKIYLINLYLLTERDGLGRRITILLLQLLSLAGSFNPISNCLPWSRNSRSTFLIHRQYSHYKQTYIFVLSKNLPFSGPAPVLSFQYQTKQNRWDVKTKNAKSMCKMGNQHAYINRYNQIFFPSFLPTSKVMRTKVKQR